MRKITNKLKIGILFLVCFALVLNTSAQSSSVFAKKMKKNGIANTAHLKAKVVNGSTSTNNKSLKSNFNPLYSKTIVLPSNVDAKKFITRKINEVRYNSNGMPNFIKADIKTVRQANKAAVKDVNKDCYDFISGIKTYIKINNPEAEFVINKIDNSEANKTHVKLQQVYKGIPVWGSELILHGSNGQFDIMNGNNFPTPNIADVNPKVSPVNAETSVLNDISGLTKVKVLTESQKKLLNYSAPQKELVIYFKNNVPVLTWHYTVRPNMVEVWQYFVDANTGSIIHKYNDTRSDGNVTATVPDLNKKNQTINTYLYNGNYYLLDLNKPMFDTKKTIMPDDVFGGIITLNANNTYYESTDAISSTDNKTYSANAVSAHSSAEIAYDYFYKKLKRNSYDDKGSNIISIINVSEQDGNSLENAYWNGNFITYGNGGTQFKPLAGSLDVGVHEFTHAVTSTTAKFIYQDESGAIDESYADIFGCMVEGLNWKVGEDIVNKAYYPSGCLRDIANPHNGGAELGDAGWQPANVSEQYKGTQDNGGVHINSSIPSYAYYTIANQITKDTAIKIYYHALTKYLTTKSSFVDLRYAVVQSAIDLYGSISSVNYVKICKDAFDLVGILDANPDTVQKDLPLNTGVEKMIYVTTNLSDTNSIYISDKDGKNAKPISKMPVDKRISVSDNGQLLLFIGLDHRLRAVDLTVANPIDTLLDTTAIWNNISISKDGNRIAMTSIYADTSIWVMNLNDGKLQRFILYNPMNGEVDKKLKGVLYADAIEWDYTGEYIVYDAYNSYKSNNSDLQYWDIGFIHVWDTTKKNFADGSIRKLVPSLGAGQNVANPTFAKNSPYILAYDFVDTTYKAYSVFGTNLNTGNTNVMIMNNTLSYPNYSVADNRVVYQTMDSTKNFNLTYFDIEKDKITLKASQTSTLVKDALFPVCFASASRILQIKNSEKEIMSYSFISPKAIGVRTGTNINVTVPLTTDLTKLVAKFTVSPKAKAYINNKLQVSDTTINDFSSAVKYTVVAEDSSKKEYIITVIKISSINEVGNSSAVSIYPSPAENFINIEFNQLSTDKKAKIEIYNIIGGKVKQVELTNVNKGINKSLINISDLQPNTYFIKLYINNEVVTRKLIKK